MNANRQESYKINVFNVLFSYELILTLMLKQVNKI